eukprot:1158512-Pelagomonas_calceolata.AAC.1
MRPKPANVPCTARSKSICISGCSTDSRPSPLKLLLLQLLPPTPTVPLPTLLLDAVCACAVACLQAWTRDLDTASRASYTLPANSGLVAGVQEHSDTYARAKLRANCCENGHRHVLAWCPGAPP